MNILLVILLIMACAIALAFVIALFMKKDHYVKREIVINVPSQEVFDYLKMLKNQEEFNTGAMEDPNRKKAFRGTDGTVGYVYSWSGNKDVGEGEKEIISIVEGKRIELEIRFIKPMVTSARIILEIEPLSGNESKVTWSNAGTLTYPVNIMIPMMKKHVVKDLDISLSSLKNILEK